MSVNLAILKRLFVAAVEIDDPSQRQAMVDRECGDDVELRRRLDALLAAHDQSASIVQAPLAIVHSETAVRNPPPETPGLVLAGRYKLLEQIGEGGMGSVWVAEQFAPVKRKVAIKLIKAGMDSKRVLARFDAERQALALMDHANIAKVMDGGMTDDHRPYFVMDYFKGIPITDYCDQVRLGLPERLELFIQVCRAVQHAHQKGIIHRDLKPSNILVAPFDDKPIPKVIDFGLAKAMHYSLTEDTLHTAHDMVLGTPLYMSPEQAQLNNLDVDTRSDIYSLGVLLYELLTGTTPFGKEHFKKAAWDEVYRIIREDDPPRPSVRLSSTNTLAALAASRSTAPEKLTRSVAGELDWIVMKALEKDRAARYETANGLANDLQCFLTGEPVSAAPPSARYRFKKFLRRHRVALAVSTVMALLLLGGIGVTAWQANRAIRAEAAALKQQRKAEDNERAAVDAAAREKRSRERAELSQAETQAVLDFVEKRVFAAARPEGQDGGLGSDVKLRDAVLAALPSMESVFLDQPLVEARLRATIGTSLRYLGESSIAEQVYQRAVLLRERELGPDHPETLAAKHGLAICYMDLGSEDLAISLFQDTLERRRRTLGARHHDTLQTMGNLATMYQRMGRYSEALDVLEETVRLMASTLGSEHPDTLRGMTNLAFIYNNQGRFAEARELAEEALDLKRHRLGTGHPDTIACLFVLARSLGELGQIEAGFRLAEEGLTAAREKFGEIHPGTLVAVFQFADFMLVHGDYDEVIQRCREALAMHEAKLGPEHRDVVNCRASLASMLQEMGRFGDAGELWDQVLQARRTRLGLDHPATLEAMSQWANSLAAEGRSDDALQLREQTLKLQEVRFGPEHRLTLRTRCNLANSYDEAGDFKQAMKLREEVLDVQQAQLGPDDPDTLLSMFNLASSYRRIGQADEARELYQQIISRTVNRARTLPDQTLDIVGKTTINLALECDAAGQLNEALDLYLQLIELAEAANPPNRSALSIGLYGAVAYLCHLDRDDEALPLIERALVLAVRSEQQGFPADPPLAPIMFNYRMSVFSGRQDLDECRATALRWEIQGRVDADSLIEAACFRGVCAQLAATLKGENHPQTQDEVRRSIDWLRQAVAAGFQDRQRLEQDHRLEALRNLDEFHRLLTEIRIE